MDTILSDKCIIWAAISDRAPAAAVQIVHDIPEIPRLNNAAS